MNKGLISEIIVIIILLGSLFGFGIYNIIEKKSRTPEEKQQIYEECMTRQIIDIENLCSYENGVSVDKEYAQQCINYTMVKTSKDSDALCRGHAGL